MLPIEKIMGNIDFNVLLMIAPVALEICKKLKINPVPFIIAIAVSSNLQGAATLVGDTTAIMLGSALNVDPTVLYFGLLSGATLGGNCTPIGASANITGIGILRKEGYTVKNADFFKIGIPFTMVAIIPAYIYLWFVYGG